MSLDNLKIVPMQAQDVDAVCKIEIRSFPYPWKKKQFEEEINLAHAHNFVATVDDEGEGRIIGYVCCWLVADEIHILNLATHPDCRRMGVATTLLTFALLFAQSKNVALATLEVRRFNTPAYRLYQKIGFETKGIRKGYYPAGEDAVVMALEVGGKTS